jgi:D-alanyl-D-alanine carboxypeptidase
MWSMLRSATLSILLAATGLAQAQTHPDVERVVLEHLKSSRHVGVSVAVMKDGAVVHAGGYGWADLEQRVQVRPETWFLVGSITKPFTSTLVMKMVEEGSIDLEAPAKQYLPFLPEAWDAVRVRHLLNHTSGIPSYTSMKEMWERQREDVAFEEIVRMSFDKPLEFPPGEKWSYNNTGYVMLGMILERVAGRPFEEILKEHILQPAGLKVTAMNEWKGIVPHRARGYNVGRRGPENAEYLSMKWPFSAGALGSTAAELVAWSAAFDDGRLLSPSSLEKMARPTKLANGSSFEYGFGWGLERTGGYEVLHHGGGINGFSSFLLRIPKERFAVAVLMNAEEAAEPIARHVAGVFFASLKPQPAVEIEDTMPQQTRLIRQFLSELLQGRVDRSKITEEFSAIMTPEVVENAKNQLGRMGQIEKFVLIAHEASPDGSLQRRYTVLIGEFPATVVASLTPDGKIAGFAVRPAG